MDYNEYNSNGEKKKFSFDLKDKTSRSRFILFFYVLLFVFLIIFVRVNYSSNVNNKKENINNNQIQETNNNEIKKEENNINENNNMKEKNEIDSMFSFIDLNNYEFKFSVSYSDKESIVEGKRFNNKFDFTLNSDGRTLYFNGNSNYIKAKEKDGDYKTITFPYVLINYFDSDLLKKIINNSKLENDVYKISNSELGSIINENLDNQDSINEISLVKKNNKVVGINMDFTSAVSSYTKQYLIVKLNLEYKNFGLVDDFQLF